MNVVILAVLVWVVWAVGHWLNDRWDRRHRDRGFTGDFVTGAVWLYVVVPTVLLAGGVVWAVVASLLD